MVVIVFIGIPRIVVISNSVCICFLFRQKLPLASAVETFHKEKTTHIEQYEKQQKVSTQRPVRGVEGMWHCSWSECVYRKWSCPILGSSLLLTPTFLHISLVMSPFLSSLLFSLSLHFSKSSLAGLAFPMCLRTFIQY